MLSPFGDVRSKLANILIAILLIFGIGGHWAVLQSLAWFGMVVNYSHSGTFGEALTKTFDGKHPCQLCKIVQQGKKSEQKQALLKVEIKLDWLALRSQALLYPPPFEPVLSSDGKFTPPRVDTPPTPPPRFA